MSFVQRLGVRRPRTTKLPGHLWIVVCAVVLAVQMRYGSSVGQTLLDSSLEFEPYACCVIQPTGFQFIPNDSVGVDLLVIEKFFGRVAHFRDGVFQGFVLDLAVNTTPERGLLGITAHPGFLDEPWVYLGYTSSSTGDDTTDPAEVLDNRVVRYLWDGSALVSPQVLLQLPALPGPNHNGGPLLFGPDGKLYGSIGDLNQDGQLQNFPAGPPANDAGMIFRLNDDGTFPADNPFFALGGGMQKVYAYGVRNSFGLDFDPLSGVLWVTDNGPADYDEIDRVPPGFNGGWEPIMGPDARDPQGVADLWMAPGATYVDPVFSWLVSMGVTSLYFVRTDALGTHYRYDCLVADSNNQNLYHFEVSADRVGLVMPDASVADLVADTSAERDLFLLGAGWGTITDIDTGPDGALYVASKSLQTVFRITRKRTSDAGQPRGPGRTRVEAGPNPFRSSTLLRLMGPAVEAPRSLRIYSPRGRLVRVLHATRGSVPWDGADERGAPVAAGVYLVRLHRPAHPRVETKVVRLR